jgi:dimethylargininase
VKLAITREVSPLIVNCELTYLDRDPIDFEAAKMQHQAYCKALSELGLRVITLPHSSLPDGVFVEDPAVVVD